MGLVNPHNKPITLLHTWTAGHVMLSQRSNHTLRYSDLNAAVKAGARGQFTSSRDSVIESVKTSVKVALRRAAPFECRTAAASLEPRALTALRASILSSNTCSACKRGSPENDGREAVMDASRAVARALSHASASCLYPEPEKCCSA